MSSSHASAPCAYPSVHELTVFSGASADAPRCPTISTARALGATTNTPHNSTPAITVAASANQGISSLLVVRQKFFVLGLLELRVRPHVPRERHQHRRRRRTPHHQL